jgi:hypothetical protein
MRNSYEDIQLNRLLERLTNVIYTLKIQTKTYPELYSPLETAEQDLAQLKELLHHVRVDGADKIV